MAKRNRNPQDATVTKQAKRNAGQDARMRRMEQKIKQHERRLHDLEILTDRPEDVVE